MRQAQRFLPLALGPVRVVNQRPYKRAQRQRLVPRAALPDVDSFAQLCPLQSLSFLTLS